MTALATRCPQCGTSFRVSEEQLAISDGHVRCGRCDAVFQARESLFDLDASTGSRPMPLDVPPELPPPPPAPSAASFATPEVRSEPTWQEPSLPIDDDFIEAAAPDPLLPQPGNTVTAEDPQSRLRDLLGVSPGPAPASQWSSLQTARVEQGGGASSSRWAVALASLAAALLALALPLQWAWIEREALLARSPRLEAWLRSHWSQLPTQGWRRVDELSVADSSLRATPQGGAYQLELTLHNRAPHALAMPWLDLSLSDAQGGLLMRRVVAPRELGLQQPLGPGEQRRVRSLFRLDGAPAKVTGYEIGLFHP